MKPLLTLLLTLTSLCAQPAPASLVLVGTGKTTDGPKAWAAYAHLLTSPTATVPIYSTVQILPSRDGHYTLTAGTYGRVFSTRYMWVAVDAAGGSGPSTGMILELGGVVGLRIPWTHLQLVYKPSFVKASGADGGVQMFGVGWAF